MKYINNLILNLALDYIRNNADTLYICSDAPIFYTDLATMSLGSASININSFSLTKTGLVSGRRVSVLDTEVTTTASGDAIVIALADVSSVDLLYATTMNTATVINASIYSVQEWDIEFRSPV